MRTRRRRGHGRRAPACRVRAVHLDALHAAARRVLLQHIAAQILGAPAPRRALRPALPSRRCDRCRSGSSPCEDVAAGAHQPQRFARRRPCRPRPPDTPDPLDVADRATSVRNASRLWPPSKRTSSPSRQAEMPRRGRPRSPTGFSRASLRDRRQHDLHKGVGRHERRRNRGTSRELAPEIFAIFGIHRREERHIAQVHQAIDHMRW